MALFKQVLLPEENQQNKHTQSVSFKADNLSFAKFALLQHFNSCKNKEAFIHAFNCGAYPELLKQLGKVSLRTVLRWKAQLADTPDPEQLARKKPGKSGAGSTLSQEEKDLLIKIALDPNKPSISEICRTAQQVFTIKNIPAKSTRTYERFLNEYRAKNYDVWTYVREGKKALNDKVLPFIERDYNRIETGDIIMADGHTLNFTLVNPFTGKPKRMTLILFLDFKSQMPLGCEIYPVENILGVASAFRRAILTLGFAPKIVLFDNGRAFRSKFFNGAEDITNTPVPGLIERLGSKVQFAKPYHGQTKPIEPWFRTFAEFERMMPTYSGTSIEHKPARLMRNEKEHQLMHTQTFNNVEFTIPQAYQLIYEYFYRYATREHQAGFYKGRTPLSIYEESIAKVKEQKDYQERIITPDRLDYLMMTETTRLTTRNGVRLFGHFYFNEKMYGLREVVTVRYDIIDTSSVLVYTQDGDFICRAYRPELVHPAAQLGLVQDTEELQKQLFMQSKLLKQTKQQAQEQYSPDVIANKINLLGYGINTDARSNGPELLINNKTKELEAEKIPETNSDLLSLLTTPSSTKPNIKLWEFEEDED